MVFHKFNAYKRGKCDVDGVDYEEIRCSEEVVQLPCRQAVSGGAQGRHKGCCYGNARNHISLVCASESYDACTTADKGNEHVVDCRRCAGKEFAVLLVDRRNEKVESGRDYREPGRHEQVSQAAFQKFEVVYAYAEANAYNRPHQR